MQKSKFRVLLLGSGTQGLAMARCLSKSGFEVFIICGKDNYADRSRYIKKVFYNNDNTLSNHFLTFVLDIVELEHIDTIIPMGDVDSEFLSVNKSVLQKFVRYDIPNICDFKRGTDKNQLMSLCKKKQYPHPLTINSDEIDNTDLKSLPYPFLIKPNITCGARGMTLCNNYDVLIEALPKIKEQYGDCHLQKYIRTGGAQVEVQLYINEDRELVNSSVIYKYRWYPEKGGSSCCAKSVKNYKIVDTLYHLLLDLNWVGLADFDTIEDPDSGELLIMELNPRVPACVKCAIEAGINWGEIIANGYLRQPQKQYNYSENEYLRHLGFETLWFLKSSNRFKTKPSWFQFIGKHIHYQDMSDWTDPMPFIIGSLQNIKKLFDPSFKQSKQI